MEWTNRRGRSMWDRNRKKALERLGSLTERIKLEPVEKSDFEKECDIPIDTRARGRRKPDLEDLDTFYKER